MFDRETSPPLTSVFIGTLLLGILDFVNILADIAFFMFHFLKKHEKV